MYSNHWLQCTSDITYIKITFRWKNLPLARDLGQIHFLRFSLDTKIKWNHEKVMLKCWFIGIFRRMPPRSGLQGNPLKNVPIEPFYTILWQVHWFILDYQSGGCDTYHSEARTTFDREIKFTKLLRRFFSALLIFRPRSELSNSVMENSMAFRPYKIIQ